MSDRENEIISEFVDPGLRRGSMTTRVLHYVSTRGAFGMTPRVLLNRMKVKPEDREAVSIAIIKLMKDGQIVERKADKKYLGAYPTVFVAKKFLE